MAANGVQHVFAPVLAAHSTMSSGADRAQKEQAHQFLEQFQKSVRRMIQVCHRGHADSDTGRSMDNDAGYAGDEQCGRRRKTVRSYHTKGQSGLFLVHAVQCSQ